MKIRDREITIANRFVYYYASFIKRIYGFVLRREGENLANEHYTGRMPSRSLRRRLPAQQKDEPPRRVDLHRLDLSPGGRWEGDPEIDEIVLFRYRKRLMLGCCQEVLPRVGSAISVVSEDHRHLKFHRDHLVYLTGVSVSEDRSFLRTYAASVRELSAQIDLREVWDLAVGGQEPLAIGEIASLYWDDDVDASRWVALYLHLDGACPYFEPGGSGTFVPLPGAEAAYRQRQRAHWKDVGHEWEEFIHWLCVGREEPYDPETLTKRQQGWLEQVRHYALWGTGAQGWKQARKILSETSPDGGDLRRHAFDLLVQKGIWESDEDLELHRAEIPLQFSEEAVRAAGEIDLAGVLRTRGRKALRRRVFTVAAENPDVPELGISLRRRWWRRGYELGVHIPDVAAFVPAGCALDRAASDRMAGLRLPDRCLPMLPTPISDGLGRLKAGTRRPSLSVIWKLDRRLVLKDVKILSTAIAVCENLCRDDAEAACRGGKHPFGEPLRILCGFAERLRSRREAAGAVKPFGIPDIGVCVQNGDVRFREVASGNEWCETVRELAILAAVEIGTYCTAHRIPAIFETRDAPQDRNALSAIPNPVVRRHETRRQTPPTALSAAPGVHHGLGVSGLASIAAPLERYPDLVLQRQVSHHLLHGKALHSQDELDSIRYRAQEEMGEMDALRRRRERYWVLKHLSLRAGEIFPAVVLYIRRDGVLVELVEYPLKTVVRPRRPVAVGEEVRVRISGVDLWRSEAYGTIVWEKSDIVAQTHP